MSASGAAHCCVPSPGIAAYFAPTDRFRARQSSRRARRDRSSQARACWKPAEFRAGFLKENDAWPKVKEERLRFSLPVAPPVYRLRVRRPFESGVPAYRSDSSFECLRAVETRRRAANSAAGRRCRYFANGMGVCVERKKLCADYAATHARAR